MKIYPSLFIGIGSTGQAMIEQLQGMVFEHYGRPSLDVFQYVVIESRERATVKSTTWGENKINLVKPTISNTDAISLAMTKGHKEYLAEWIDPNLLTIDGGAFMDGASNIRMAGKLILWENWELISEALVGAVDKITSGKNVEATKAFLKNHYDKHKLAIDPNDTLVDPKPNIYIAGTLCGGTCSGMFIDIAYFIKEHVGLWQKDLENRLTAKVIGVFSTFDHATLSTGGHGLDLHAANSWAALKEYDFFCHTQTRYESRFPGGTVVNTNERPVDTLYLMSCTASTPKWNVLQSNFRKDNGSPDIDSLNHSAATLMFSETVGGLLESKDEIRTDFRGQDRALKVNENHHSPCISTCGIATIWYPKLRIARGAACKHGQFFCDSLMSDLDPGIERDLDTFTAQNWNEMFDRAGEILESSAKGTLVGDIGQLFARKSSVWMGLPANELKRDLETELKKLNRGGFYEQEITRRREEFRKSLIADINTFLATAVNEGQSLSQAIYCLKKLDSTIITLTKKMGSNYPKVDLKEIRLIKADRSARLVFAKGKVEQALSHDLLEHVEDYVSKGVKRVRNYHMRALLDNIREEIGLTRKFPKPRRTAGEISISQRLIDLRDKLLTCSNKLEAEYNRLSDEQTITQDVKCVYQYETLKDDVNTLAAHLETASDEDKAVIIAKILNGRSLAEFIGLTDGLRKIDDIADDISKPLLKICLDKVAQYDVAEAVNKMLPSDVAFFAKMALPHLELSGGHSGLASVKINRPVSFVAGANEDALGKLLALTLAGTECNNVFSGEHSPTIVNDLAHMVLFYCEEPLMYMDENLATAGEFATLYKKAGKESIYGLHTHKGGEAIFDPSVYSRRAILRNELMPLACKIFSKEEKSGVWESSEIFKIENGKLVYRGKRGDGSNVFFNGDDSGIRVCAADKELYEIMERLIDSLLENMTYDQFIQKLNEYIERFEATLPDDDKKAEKYRIEQQAIKKINLLRKRYPEIIAGE